MRYDEWLSAVNFTNMSILTAATALSILPGYKFGWRRHVETYLSTNHGRQVTVEMSRIKIRNGIEILRKNKVNILYGLETS